MKKILALVLALTMVMAMAACTPATNNDATNGTTEATTEATTPVAPAPTGDASVIVSSVAVLVLSAIGGTALIIKKKEN